ncbi:MAG: serine--tRNA ligase, partial [Fidelibacterota bacterium]
MLSLKFIRENPETVRKAIKSRGEVVDLDLILSLDERWRKILQENNDLRHKKNIVSRQIARIKKEGGSSEELISQIQEVVSQIKNYDDELRNIESRIDELLLFIPNIPHPTVPVGPDPSCNKIVREWGEPPEVDFPL